MIDLGCTRSDVTSLFDKGGLHIDGKIVGLSISQWLPCPLAIWNLLFGMAILLNLVNIFHTAFYRLTDANCNVSCVKQSIQHIFGVQFILFFMKWYIE